MLFVNNFFVLQALQYISAWCATARRKNHLLCPMRASSSLWNANFATLTSTKRIGSYIYDNIYKSNTFTH